MEQHSVARLIGAPPGYVGYEEGGYLTEAVRRRPYSVLLLDEVEKAHPDVFNILLQVMDDGRLTDGHGRTVDFRNTVIVMTSNLGSDRIQEAMSSGDFSGEDSSKYEQVKSSVMEAVVRHFSPEFVNRIDESVVFHPLQQDQIRGIAEIQIGLLNKRLAQSELAVEVSDAVLDHVAKVGYDPVYGARPLKRAIQNAIENPLAQQVLQGDYGPGDRIAIDMPVEGELSFRKIPATPDSEVA
jgi:ATP-dependent Clp protease ATP-binding subunit ClpB